MQAEPSMDIKYLEEITKLPSFTVEKELPDQTENLVVVVISYSIHSF